MARRRDGITERKCGCLYYEYGPPLLCGKHEVRATAVARKTLRSTITDHIEANGHALARWSEYESMPGKWTTYCTQCGEVVIAYEEIPQAGDQVNSHILDGACRKSTFVAEDAA
jgi:hypothetical protein